MPSVGSASSSTHQKEHAIPILSFDQLSQDPASGDEHNPDDSDAHGAALRDDENLADVTSGIMTTDTRAVSKSRLYLMVSADFGLSFTWLCKFAVATPYFRHSLKAGAFLSHLVWIMGPLSGLIVAPVIGVLSDRCTWRLGRRRPFIILGSVFSIVGMLIFANVIAITKGQLFIARLLAVFAFGLLDFSTNVIMFPSRALLGDLLPTYQQHDAQSAAAVIASIGEVCAGAYIYSLKDAVTNISRIFTIASILVAVSSSISIYFCQETPLTSSSSLPNTTTNTNLDSTQPNQSKHRNILTSVHTKNSQLKQHQQHNHDMHSSPIINGMRNGHSEQDEDIEMLTLNDDEPVPLSPLSANDVETSTTIPSRPHRDTNSSSTSNSTTVPTSTIDEKSILPSPSSPPSPATSHPAPPHLPLSTSVSTLPPPPSASLQPHTASSQGLRSELMSTIGTALVNFPRSLVPIGLVYGLAWFLWFASLPYYSQWIGEDVLGGDAHASAGSTAASLYQQGVQVFSIANMVKALTALVFAAFYPTIITCIGNIGERMVFSVSFFIFSSVLLICADSKDVYVAGFVVALGAIPFIVTQTIPIAIVVQRYPQNLASNLGVMNLFCVIPQLVDTLYTGKVAEVAGESVVLKVAAGWGFATAVSALIFL